MLKFKNVENLTSYIVNAFEIISTDSEQVNIVCDRELAIKIMSDLVRYYDAILEKCDIDIFDYDKEYSIEIEMCNKTPYISIEKAYDDELNIYYSTDGLVLFEENVNSKCQVDMQNNEFCDAEYSWFVINEN